MELKDSVPCSQEPSTGSSPGPYQVNIHFSMEEQEH
jgi:hypothetical protein